MNYLNELFNKRLSLFFKWLQNKPLIIKLIIILTILISIIFLSRIGIFGEYSKTLSKILIPNHINRIDDNLYPLQLNFSFDVTSENIRKAGLLGGRYYTADIVHLLINIDDNAHLAIIGIDSKGIYTIYPNDEKGYSQLIKKTNKLYEINSYSLNNTTGEELFYAVTHRDKFKIKNIVILIKEHFNNKINSKGISDSKFLNLPFGFTNKAIYFQHLNNISKK